MNPYKMSYNTGVLLYASVFFTASIFLFNLPSFGQAYKKGIDLHIPYQPALVHVNGKQTAYYELYLTNFSNDSIQLTKLDIADNKSSFIYLRCQKQDLISRYSRIGSMQKDTNLWLPPGTAGLLYIEIAAQQKRNAHIRHRISYVQAVGNDKKADTVEGASLTLFDSPQLVLGAPLKEGIWTAVYEPGWQNGHRRVIYTVDGKARIPGRYAVDFIKMNAHGRFAHDNEDEIKNWFGYGDPVFAVADGMVSSVKDDFPESPSLSGHPKYAADKATGNYISIQIGKNQYAFYEHLKPGSITVKPGQCVKKGELIAALGFTGQTTGPHLHFHVANADSPLGAEGIPFVFDQFQVLGSYTDFENFGKKTWTPSNELKQSIRKQERPAANAVIRFK